MSEIVQNTPEWLEMRKSKVGASDAPIIMGVSPYKTPYQLWREKLSLDESKWNGAMQRGHDLEDKARAKFVKMTGINVEPKVLFHPRNKWMMASLDGYYMDDDDEYAVEIKCPNKNDHELALNNMVPEKYQPQLQHQLAVTEMDMMYYFSFDGENGVIVEVTRDDKYIKQMIKEELKFYECMTDLIPPKLTDRDYVQRSDEEWEKIAAQWKLLKEQMIQLEDEEERLRMRMIELAENQNSIGGGVKLAKQIKKGSVDYSKIPELKEINLEPYRKSAVEFWKINPV